MYLMFKKKLYYQQPYINSKPFFTQPRYVSYILRDILNKPKNEISDSEGLSRACKQPDKLYINNNKLYIAGTCNLRDVIDDTLIPFKLTRFSQRYMDADKILRNNKEI